MNLTVGSSPNRMNDSLNFFSFFPILNVGSFFPLPLEMWSCDVKNVFFICLVIFTACYAYPVPVASRDEGGSCGDNLTFTYNNKTSTLTIRGTGDMTDYEDYSAVPWFSFRSDITDIILEDGITSIGKYAFYRCKKSTHVRIPSTVTSIRNSAFYKCESLLNVTIPPSVTSIDTFAFANCENLKDVTILSSSATIDIYAFDRCSNLKSVIMPNGVSSISQNAFRGCNNISTIIYNGDSDPCDGSSLFDDSSLEFVCVPESYEQSAAFCGIRIRAQSNSCEELLGENNQCFVVERNGTIHARANVSEWENNSSDCLKYYCDNNTGPRIRAECNKSEGITYVCVNDACVDFNTLSDKEKVDVVLQLSDINDWNTTMFIDSISNQSGVDPDKIQVNVEFDDNDTQIVHIIVFVDDKDTAKTIFDSLQNCQNNKTSDFLHGDLST